MKPVTSILLGVALMVGSWVFMFAIILNLVSSTFPRNFLAYGLAMAGFAIAFRGGYLVWLERRHEAEKSEETFDFPEHPEEE